MKKRRLYFFCKRIRGWVFPWPLNVHVHFRDPADALQKLVFAMVVAVTARLYCFATAMPNLGKNRIQTPEQAIAYRRRIERVGKKKNPLFKVTVPLYLEPTTWSVEVERGYKMGAWTTAKLYPKGGTTHSDFGVDFNKLEELYPVFTVMEKLGMILLIHAEPQFTKDGREIDPFDRESRSLPIIEKLLRRFKRLKVVFEHISSAAAVRAIKRWQRKGYRIEATIAPQYLLWNRGRLFQGGINPIDYSIPALKREKDRLALVKFMVEGGGMLGTDSAPHVIEAKQKLRGAAGGVFNEPVGLFIYFDIFKKSGRKDWLKRFVEFACLKPARFYGVKVPTKRVAIIEKAQQIPEKYVNGNAVVIPMFAGEKIPFQLVHYDKLAA